MTKIKLPKDFSGMCFEITMTLTDYKEGTSKTVHEETFFDCDKDKKCKCEKDAPLIDCGMVGQKAGFSISKALGDLFSTPDQATVCNLHTCMDSIEWYLDDWHKDAFRKFEAELVAANTLSPDEMAAEAAPELLAACRLMVALEDNEVPDADTRWKQVRKDMRAAIAKAKVESK